jgi:hypothetical protein
MSQTLHIVRKDVRRLRWVLVLWVMVLAMRVAFSLITLTSAESANTSYFLRQLFSPIITIELLITALIVVRLVHEEPLVGFTPFWLTRPYDRGALVRAKLLFATVVLVGLPLLAELITMGLLKAGPVALMAGGAAASVAYVAGTLSLVVAAALTPSFSAFALTLLGVVVGTLMVTAIRVGLASLWRPDYIVYTPPQAPDATPGVVMLLVYAAAALAVVLYQYHHRRWRAATGLAVAGLAATIVVPIIWPWSFARAAEVRPGAWVSTVTAVHDPAAGTRVSVPVRMRSGGFRRQVMASLTTTGVPPLITAQRVGVRSRLHFPDGTSIESGQTGFWAAGTQSAIIAALGSPRLLYSRDQPVPTPWVPMVTLTEEQFARYRGQSGQLVADLDFQLARTREVAVLRLAQGAAFDDGVSRIEIMNVQRQPEGRDVMLRQWRVRSLLAAEWPVQRFFVLRNRARGEALMGGTDFSNGSGPMLGSSPAMERLRFPLGVLMGGYGAAPIGDGFSAGTTFMRFPSPNAGRLEPIDPAWFDGAELVVLETEWAGITTRPLTIDQFPLPTTAK